MSQPSRARSSTRADPERRRARTILARLHQAYPNATTELRFSNPLELLVATILSAQCTDERVNQVTEQLFRKYRTAADYASADPAQFEQEIRPTGFFRNKTKSILGAARMIVEQFGGQVPANMDDLLKLPGVQRKTANVVLGAAFGIPSGIVVDTHVRRVAQRLGLVPADDNDPGKIEQRLMELFPKEGWIEVSFGIVLHGRYVCTARRPRCAECMLADLCPKVGVQTQAASPASASKRRGGK
jgi:endonuclease-3